MGNAERPSLALLPSPLLGPSVWRPVAKHLSSRGWQVVETPAPPESPRSPNDVLEQLLAALPAGRALILVAHSNAGLYVPAIADQRQVVANVFVDAGLPPGSGPVPLAPEGLKARLGSLADSAGLLPVWTSWWDRDDVAVLFPTPEVREQVEAEQHALPLSYFDESLFAPAGWDRVPGGYLAFGETYADERAAAGGRGWPVRTMTGGHLHMLMEPMQVTDALEDLLTDLIG